MGLDGRKIVLPAMVLPYKGTEVEGRIRFKQKK